MLGWTFDAYVSDRPDEPERFTIVGVLPPTFWHVNVYTDVMAPLTARTYPYMVRARPGVGAQALGERLSSVVRGAGLGVPDGWRATAVPTQRSYTAALRPVLGAVGVAAALVLLIACANVAVLLLVHTHRRRHEMAVRMALGGSRLHAMRLVAFEALILGSAATTAALVSSTVLVDALASSIEQPLGRRVPGGPSTLGVDAVVGAAAILGGAAAMLGCSLAPIVLAGHSSEPAALAPSRSATDAPSARRLRSGFLALQVALALALVVGALLVTESARRMLSVDLGLRTDVLVAGTGLRQKTYPDAASRVAFYDGLLGEVVRLVPGGRVAVSDWWPLQQPRARATTVVGEVGHGQQVAPAVMAVSPGYFETLGIALRDGRAFSDGDRLGAAPVAIVSDSLARRLWPSARAVGRVLRLEPPPSDDSPRDRTTEVAIVGVVADVRQSAGDQELDDLYLSGISAATAEVLMPCLDQFSLVLPNQPFDAREFGLREPLEGPLPQ